MNLFSKTHTYARTHTRTHTHTHTHKNTLTKIVSFKFVNIEAFQRTHSEYVHVILVKFCSACCCKNPQTFCPRYRQEAQVQHVGIYMQPSMKVQIPVSTVYFMSTEANEASKRNLYLCRIRIRTVRYVTLHTSSICPVVFEVSKMEVSGRAADKKLKGPSCASPGTVNSSRSLSASSHS